MFLVQQITADYRQKLTLALADGTAVGLVLYYRPIQQGWFIEELQYPGFSLRGVRICNYPNLLHPFINKIPFGLGCYSTPGNREPTQLQDFSSGASKLYVLSAAETLDFAEYLKGA